jgi:hypothetical protein
MLIADRGQLGKSLGVPKRHSAPAKFPLLAPSSALIQTDNPIRMEAKRKAVDTLSGTDFEPGVAQKWAQFFVSEKSDEAKSLKRSGEPGRTRTCNPLIKSQLLYH